MDRQISEGSIRELQAQVERDRLNVLLTQINSHFFYHTLNAIQALIVLEPEKAYKMTEDFSRFLRFKVDSIGIGRGLVPFKDEMRSVRAYADINAVLMRGLYPCGEGAGYAGGILSAAADGMRIAEQICGTLSEQGGI